MSEVSVMPKFNFAGLFFGLLLLASLLAYAGVFRSGETAAPDLTVAAWLAFDEGPNGILEVREASSEEPLRALDPVTDSFARGVYKSVARARIMRGIAPTEPMQLGRTADGQLMLFDPETSTNIALRAFGPTNAAVFETILERVLANK